MPGYAELCKRVKAIHPQIISQATYTKKFSSRDVYFVKDNYPGLVNQIRCHSLIRLDPTINAKIVNEMKANTDFRNFVCINVQQFFKIISQNYDGFLEKNDDPIFDGTEMKVIWKFGFLKVKDPKYISSFDVGEADYYLEVFQHYQRSLSYFLPQGTSVDFQKNIVVPFKKLLTFLGFTSFTESNDYIYISDNIEDKNIQNMFACLQFHTFFEDYINSLFDPNAVLARNPIVLINPRIDPRNNNLDGYLELDGSFVKNGNEIIFLECKNSSRITVDYVTNFLGKVHLIERIYGVKIRKMLFSTGSRYRIWDRLEQYPTLNDLEIYDLRDFRANYQYLRQRYRGLVNST